jgi:predicted outer membrane repeat protein
MAIGVTSATQTVTVRITTAGTLAKISVLTQGATGLDYVVVAGGTCTLTTSYTVGQSCTVKFSFTPSHPWVRYGGISLSDASGMLLGNSFLNGVGTGPQVSYPLSAATVPSLLGSGFSSPLGVAVDGSGNVYVADTSHNSVKELMAVGGVVPASPTVVTWSGFSSPSGVAVDGSGNVYVADTGNNAVKEMVAVGGVVPATPTIVPLGSGYSSPTGVAVDGSGNVYVADMNHNAVKELVASGGVIPSGATPTPLGSGFSTPQGVAVDGSGDVFVADTHNNFVKEIVAVGGVIPASPTITPLGSGYFLPSGVAVDGSGNVYIADTGNNAIKEIVAVGGVIPSSPTIATLGTGFNAPGGVGVDAGGDVYVADTGNSAAKEMSAQSPPTLTFATTAAGSTSSDSPRTVTITNNGNATLTLSALSATSNYNLIGAGTTCTGTSIITAGSSCGLAVTFAPTSTGTLTGTANLTDNNLNGSSVSQALSLTGFGAAVAPNVSTVSAASAPFASTTGITVTSTESGSAGVVTGGVVTFGTAGGVGGSFSPTTCTLTAGGTCTTTYTPSGTLNVGTYASDITASFAANNNYAVADGSSTLTIAAMAQSIGSFTTLPATVTYGVAPLALSATATSGLTATFRVVSGPASITGASNNQLTIAGAGTVVVGADQGGNANYTAATEVTQTITVNPTAYVVNATSDDASGNAANCPPNPTGSGSGSCTLRDALAAAASGGGTITFDATVFATAQTITLTSGSTLNIPSTTTITGATTGSGATLANLVTVAGGGSSSDFPVFSVGYGFTGVAIANLTITNGYSPTLGGGGINNYGTLTVTGCSFSGNIASSGGGIISYGTLTVSNSIFSGNSATSYAGGGIYSYTGTLTVTDSTFTGNSGGNYGGGIYSVGTQMLSGSTFSGNSALYDGGGIVAGNGTVTNSTFYNNSSALGGAIYNQGVLTVTGSTLSGNSANSSPALGGGIFNQGTLTLSNSTLSGNSTNSSGSGAGVFGNGGQTVNASYNVFYNNLGFYGMEDDCADSCTNTNAISGDPKLLPLGNYGGTTQTMLPQPGSAAICAASASLIPVGVTTDQRGKPNSTTYGSTTCNDAGAVQTNYALNFTAQQPSSVIALATMSPAPIVTVTESGSTFTAGAATVSLSDADADLGASSTASASTSSGAASFSNLQFTHAETGDTLAASLALTTSLNATAVSGSFNVTQSGQTITFTPTISSYSFSVGSFAVSATASSTLAVSFASTTGSVCSVSGSTVTLLSVGTCTIQATQSGSTDYFAATPVSANFTITQASQSIAFTPSSPVTYGVSPIALTATGAASGNAVSFSVVSGPGSIGGSTLTVTGAGTIVVAANQAGNSNYTAATQVTASIVVNQASQSIAFTPSSPVTYGVSPIALTATGGATGNAVSFSLVSGPGSIGGSTLTVTAAGTIVVAANQTGNSNYTAATQVTASIVVDKAMATVTLGSLTPTYTGSVLVATATTTPTGLTVNFTYNGSSTAPTAAGSYTVVGMIGDSNYQGSSTGTLVIGKATPAIAWATPAAIAYGTALSATQLNANSTIAGTFVYTPASGTLTAGSQTLSVILTPTDTTDYTTATATVTLTVNKATPAIAWATPASIAYGTALSATQFNASSTIAGTFVYTPALGTLTAGSQTLSVTLTPTDSTDYTTATATVTLTVNNNAQTISFTAPSSVTYGIAPIALSATGGPSGNAVTFSVFSGPGSITGNTLTITGAGRVVVAANQLGNANYTAAAQVTQSIVVDRALPAIAVASSANPVLAQNALTFTATVYSAVSTPTGTIAFEDGATVLGSGILTAGVATFTTSSLAVGTHTIAAVYSGDANFAASSSAALTQTIQDFSLTISTSTGSTGTVTQSVVPGGTATYTFNVTPTGGTVFLAEVDFTISGLPAGATATFTPPSIAAGSGTTTVTLTVNMPQQTGMLAPGRKPGMEPFGRRLAPIALGILLLPFAGKMRRSGKRLGRLCCLLLLLLASAGAVAGLSGCGGDNGFFTQAPQSYTLTITASSGGLQRSTNVTLNLQ